MQDRTKEAVKGLPEYIIDETEDDKFFCSSVLSVNLLFIGMVNGRVNVLKEYVQNGLSEKAREQNEQARKLCEEFDELMPTLIAETRKREGSWC